MIDSEWHQQMNKELGGHWWLVPEILIVFPNTADDCCMCGHPETETNAAWSSMLLDHKPILFRYSWHARDLQHFSAKPKNIGGEHFRLNLTPFGKI